MPRSRAKRRWPSARQVLVWLSWGQAFDLMVLIPDVKCSGFDPVGIVRIVVGQAENDVGQLDASRANCLRPSTHACRETTPSAIERPEDNLQLGRPVGRSSDELTSTRLIARYKATFRTQ